MTCAAANPGCDVALPNFPDRVEVTGTDFIEFTSQGAEKQRLEQQLVALGFRPAARHVAKQVTLWQQGDIRILLNTEMAGHAHRAWLEHGTTVCDFGLGVASARDTVARGLALGAEAFRQPVGPGNAISRRSAGSEAACCISSMKPPGWPMSGPPISRPRRSMAMPMPREPG